jgi:hypothetical protein
MVIDFFIFNLRARHSACIFGTLAGWQSETNIFTINDTFDIIRGKHDIKVGGGIRINQMNVRAEGLQDGFWIVSGDWTGSSMADMVGLKLTF